ALAKARRLRAEIARGAAKFEDVAKKESGDSVSGARGGDLGWVKRTEASFDPQFLAALRRLAPGELSQPAPSSFGYHLIRVDAAARSEKKQAIARQHATLALAALASAPDLLQAGRARGLPVDKLGPFTRLNPASAIARDPAVEGAAFGLRPGQRTGVLVGTTGCFILQGIAHQA